MMGNRSTLKSFSNSEKLWKNAAKLWVPKHLIKYNKINWIFNFWKILNMFAMEH